MITLTRKQQIIMSHLAGMSNRQIASKMHISTAKKSCELTGSACIFSAVMLHLHHEKILRIAAKKS